MTEIPEDELITGSITDDLEKASNQGSVEDIQAVLDEYETEEVATVDGRSYYRIPTIDRGDPEVAIVRPNGSIDLEEFTEFIGDVGNGRIYSVSYDDILSKDIASQIEDEIYTQGGVLYHVTTIEKAVDILNDGVLEARNETRGRTNRGAGRAVFASELHPDNSYGDVVFEIDVDQMVANGFKPPVGREPPVQDAIADEAVAQKFHVYQHRTELESSISRDTVVIYGDIPVEYLSVDVGDSVAEELLEEVSETAASTVGL